MEEQFEKTYHDIEKKHFWFRSRRDYIISILKEFPRDIKILDIGSSSGILLNELVEIGFDVKNLYGVDISENAIRNCKLNGIENSFVMDAQNITLDEKFDVIIASDCLEHLKDDAKALNNWNSLLKKDGTLLVFVPAFMSLWSEHDVVNMHYRRYIKKELVTRLLNANFKIEKASYWNFFLFFPVYLYRSLSRLKSTNDKHQSGDLKEPSFFNHVLYLLIKFENLLLGYLNFTVGVSTFCIAKKQ